MWGRRGKNSHGCSYTPELQRDLIKSLDHTEPDFLYGMLRVLPTDMARITNTFPKDWHDAEMFADMLVEGKLGPLIRALRKKNVVLVSSRKKWFDECHWIETSDNDTHKDKDDIIKRVLEYGKPAVYLFSCGMSASVLVSELHGKIPNSFFINIGSMFDVFFGLRNRCHTEHLPDAIIRQNLHEDTQ
jgi:hypothetical protein